MLIEKILQQGDVINQIIAKYHATEWKIFGNALGQAFELLGDIHFLITPGPYLTWNDWQDLTTELKMLFPDHCVRNYTPNSLDEMVKDKELSQTAAQQAKDNAKSLDDLLNNQRQSLIEKKYR